MQLSYHRRSRINLGLHLWINLSEDHFLQVNYIPWSGTLYVNYSSPLLYGHSPVVGSRRRSDPRGRRRFRHGKPAPRSLRGGSVHNIIHILSGLVGLFAASKGEGYARQYLIVFGVIYAVVAILGFVMDGNIPGPPHGQHGGQLPARSHRAGLSRSRVCGQETLRILRSKSYARCRAPALHFALLFLLLQRKFPQRLEIGDIQRSTIRSKFERISVEEHEARLLRDRCRLIRLLRRHLPLIEFQSFVRLLNTSRAASNCLRALRERSVFSIASVCV